MTLRKEDSSHSSCTAIPVQSPEDAGQGEQPVSPQEAWARRYMTRAYGPSLSANIDPGALYSVPARLENADRRFGRYLDWDDAFEDDQQRSTISLRLRARSLRSRLRKWLRGRRPAAAG